MNLLYLIDPNSIHDQKWIYRFTRNKKNKCYFLCRDRHYKESNIKQFENDFNLKFLGTVNYFSFRRICSSLSQVKKIKQLIITYGIQLFHIQFAEPNGLWALFRRYLGIPIIITCRGTDVLKTIPSHFVKNDLLNKLISRAYKKSFEMADWVTVTSTSQKKSVQAFSSRKVQISTIRTGVDLELLFSDTASFFPDELNKPYILFPRYLKSIYNHEFAIRALKKLPSEIKTKYKIVFVGKDAGDLNYQNELVELLENDPYIDYTILPKQQQEAIWELNKRAELIVMTPKSDGSPVSGMEAIALRKKMILGPLEYDKDIFNASNAFILNSWSTKELTTAIEKALYDKYEKVNPSIDYLNKIDLKHNMLEVEKIYQKLVCAIKE